jgi:hypothetical protein
MFCHLHLEFVHVTKYKHDLSLDLDLESNSETDKCDSDIQRTDFLNQSAFCIARCYFSLREIVRASEDIRLSSNMINHRLNAMSGCEGWDSFHLVSSNDDVE